MRHGFLINVRQTRGRRFADIGRKTQDEASINRPATRIGTTTDSDSASGKSCEIEGGYTKHIIADEWKER